MSVSFCYATTERPTPDLAATLINTAKAATAERAWSCSEGLPMWTDDDGYVVGASRLIESNKQPCNDFDVIAEILTRLAGEHAVTWHVHIESKQFGHITADGPDEAARKVIAAIDKKAAR